MNRVVFWEPVLKPVSCEGSLVRRKSREFPRQGFLRIRGELRPRSIHIAMHFHPYPEPVQNMVSALAVAIIR